MNKKSFLTFLLVGLLVVSAFVIGILWQKVQNLEEKTASAAPSGALAGDSQPNQPKAPPSNPVNIKDVFIENEPFIGEKDAPVTLAYWGDFQCPFCKRFETQTLPELINKYVDNGKLKIVFKDFQFLGRDSQDAGLAAKAVWDLYPEKYFDWHKAMFEAQDEENGGFGNLESILQLIREKVPGVDADKIASQIEAKRDEYQKEQDEDKAEGAKFNINGTPGFVIGTQNISGAQPLSVFTQIIDSELNK